MRTLALLASLWAAACGGGDDRTNDIATRFDLALVGDGFTQHEGLEIVALARRTEDGAIVGNPQRTAIADGSFGLVWRAILRAGFEYEVVYFLVAAGGGCADANGHVWALPVPRTTGHALVEAVHDHALAEPSACSAFELYDLDFTGSGYTVHNGQGMGLAIVRQGDDHLVAEPKRGSIINGALYVQWRGVLQKGFGYSVHYFADHNQSGACDPPPVDHSWAVPFATRPGGDTVLNHSASGVYDDVCATFGPWTFGE